MNINLTKQDLLLSMMILYILTDLNFLNNRQKYADQKENVKTKQNKSVFKREKIIKYTLAF